MNDLEALYRQHAAAVFRFALGLCGDRSGAEDLVSETYVRLATRAPRLETQTALASVLRDLRDLPEGERTALLLRVDHDLSYEEIATVLGTSVGAARVRVHRARLRLAGSTDRKETRNATRSDA